MSADTLEEVQPEVSAKAQRKRVAKLTEGIRFPTVGDSVLYWQPHPAKEFGPADKPCHAVVANVKDDNLPDTNSETELLAAVRVTLSVLTHIGTWRQQLDVRWSHEPATNRWTWPKG